MRILCVATKCPWPPRDGGRLVLSLALQGFVDAGHEVTLIAAIDDVTNASDSAPRDMHVQHVRIRPRRWIAASLHALRNGRAITLVRHEHAVLRRDVADCVARWSPDVVHAEQLQAMSNCMPASIAGVPIVLRMQNVESNLWQQWVQSRFAHRLLQFESRRLRIAETSALQQAATTIALTANDARDLSALARPEDRSRIVCIEPAFPAFAAPGEAVSGEPALVLSGSDWWPNRQGKRWFFDQAWPRLRAALPRVRVHVFGGDAPAAEGVERHVAPAQSQIAFPRNAIAVVPLLAASGIRMRILEAWSRGVPVIASSAAACGLDVVDGRELLLVDSPAQFVDAVRRLHGDTALRRSLVDAGHAYLAARHDPARQTRALLQRFAAVTSERVGRLQR